MTDYKHEWIREFHRFARRTDIWRAFEDWCQLMAIELSNRVDWTQADARLATYNRIVKSYNSEERRIAANMFGLLVEELEHRMTVAGYEDVMGEIFHELDVQNKYKAQFFTPNCISAMMGALSLGDDWKKAVDEKGYVSINDPACGSGSTIYGALTAICRAGGNPCRDALVVAGDIDERCVNMAYVQLSLYGIPAIVLRQNALTLDKPEVWYTPVYMFDGWPLKLHHRRTPEQGDAVDAAETADVQLSLF